MLVRDMAPTFREVDGLKAGMLKSYAVVTNATRLGDMLDGSRMVVGKRCATELLVYQ